jgi:hypothetical protein
VVTTTTITTAAAAAPARIQTGRLPTQQRQHRRTATMKEKTRKKTNKRKETTGGAGLPQKRKRLWASGLLLASDEMEVGEPSEKEEEARGGDVTSNSNTNTNRSDTNSKNHSCDHAHDAGATPPQTIAQHTAMGGGPLRSTQPWEADHYAARSHGRQPWEAARPSDRRRH